MEYIINIILPELSLREVASTTMNHTENEPALHRSAPETILQLPQQQAEEPAKRLEKKPKSRSRLESQNLASGSYSCQGYLWEKSLLSTDFENSWGTGRGKRKKQIYLQLFRAKLERKCDACHHLFCGHSICDTKLLPQWERHYLHRNTVLQWCGTLDLQRDFSFGKETLMNKMDVKTRQLLLFVCFKIQNFALFFF